MIIYIKGNALINLDRLILEDLNDTNKNKFRLDGQIIDIILGDIDNIIKIMQNTFDLYVTKRLNRTSDPHFLENREKINNDKKKVMFEIHDEDILKTEDPDYLLAKFETFKEEMAMMKIILSKKLLIK